ncbi:hypothetical protein JHC09_04365 [Devosia sp. MC532]|uniref:curli-like amyloid fiber formation chaperone CsgH n=1 Tax=Devosia sp. MC532 TaxID=2799788 RepID=UPI0018F7691A|nr:curli-like amyloid fiber formation chaperone CsgH [Devosia sp. MC532]MBJ7577115.1 hypothetical protein [Devosia sp. MC532]
MTHSVIRIATLAVIGCVAASAFANQPPVSTGISCGIHASTERGMKSLEAVVYSLETISGEYRLSMKGSGGSGSTNINQGGGFTAPKAQTITMSKVTVSADAKLNIDFTITAKGVTYDCSNTISYKS